MGRMNRRCRWLAVVVALAVVSGCSSAGSGGSPAGSPPSPQRTADTTPAKTVSYTSLRQARFTIDGPDAMVAVAGALWVKTDPGHVVRIDPATNTITKTIVVDHRPDRSSYCQGIATDGTAAWSCATRRAGTGVTRIDPQTNQIGPVIQTHKVFDQYAIPSTARGLWMLSSDGSTVTVVDPASGETTSYPLPAHCTQLSAHGARLTCTDAIANKVESIDAATGKVVAEATMLMTPRISTMTDTDVWVDTAQGLTRLTPELKVESVYPGITAGLGGDVFNAGGSVWLRDSGGILYRIDADSGRVLEKISPPHPVSAGSLIAAYGSVWLSLSEEGQVLRLRLVR